MPKNRALGCCVSPFCFDYNSFSRKSKAAGLRIVRDLFGVSGLIPRRTLGERLPQLKQCNAYKNLVLNQTIL
jgi:hypothetical protein